MTYHCNLIQGKYPLLIQFILAIISLSCLLIKRFYELPKRPLKIWLLDVSKQIFTALIAHYANILIATIMTLLKSEGTKCGWYFVSYIIDTVIGGLIISIYILNLFNKYVQKHRLFYLESGFYGEPIKITYYFAQLFCWSIIVILGKIFSIIVILILALPLDYIVIGIDKIFNNASVELSFVMIFCPLIINILSLQIIDYYLKYKHKQNNDYIDL